MRITIKNAEKLPTKRLLTYFKKYGRSWTSKWFCDRCGDYLCEDEYTPEEIDGHDKEQEYWKNIKNILDKRENI